MSPITHPRKRKGDQKVSFSFSGVGNGTRTHNARNHNPVLCQLNYTHHILLGMARQEGLEPPTYCLEGSCSIQLSYKRMHIQKNRAPKCPMERVMGIEPTWSAWKAEVLPLNYTRKLGFPESALI